MRQGAHHLQAPLASALHNPLSGRGIGASSLPAPPLVTTRAGTDVLAQGARSDRVGSTRLRHTIGDRPRRSQRTQGALAWTKARTENPHRDLVQHGAMPVAIAPRRNDAAVTQNLSQRDYRLSLRPVRARRLSKAGRHWAPIARQRATRKERHSGRTWPTYCNKPNGRRPSSTAWCALSPPATAAVKPKTFFRSDVFLEGL